ncbi:unnamed protein product [Phytophthora fragariaefolia]|uniref:Unnamed protein product n=1 Tax=Phytophthora fragariaefolia TaxID=1490495 RepID=A0A9W7DB63_9STRA|nr:unnamed protein product [Phytophthora fragariaefolia]
MAMCEDESITVVDNSATDPAEFECSANEIDLEDYAHELAFLPDLTDSASTVLDYGGSNVVCSAHTPSQQEKLVKALKAQEGIMIATTQGPAQGGADRLPNSPWASPIVIVLKKNGVDIRLCIDYKMVNAIMEYAMPLVDDLLTELESYLWFCSLVAASGFWAVMMTQRAREISAFVCALGHFEWLRMPFGLKDAPMIYQRIIDNARWGYVRPRGGCASYAEKVRRAEAASATQRGPLSDPNQPTPDSVNTATKFEADHRALAVSDPLQDLVNSPESDMFISFTKSIFVQPAVDFLSHEVSQHEIRANPAKLTAIAELPFPTSKKGMQGFLGALNYYNRFIQNMAVYGAVLYQLKDADFADGDDLADAKSAFAELKTKVANAPILRHYDSAKKCTSCCSPTRGHSVALCYSHTMVCYTRYDSVDEFSKRTKSTITQLRRRFWHSYIY